MAQSLNNIESNRKTLLELLASDPKSLIKISEAIKILSTIQSQLIQENLTHLTLSKPIINRTSYPDFSDFDEIPF